MLTNSTSAFFIFLTVKLIAKFTTGLKESLLNKYVDYCCNFISILNMIKKYFIFLTLILSVYSCTVISEKATQKADKENAYLSTFLNKSSSNLNSTLGKPTQVLSESNLTVHVYEVKGTIFDCQRKFTIDNKNIVTGFVSTCWD